MESEELSESSHSESIYRSSGDRYEAAELKKRMRHNYDIADRLYSNSQSRVMALWTARREKQIPLGKYRGQVDEAVRSYFDRERKQTEEALRQLELQKISGGLTCAMGQGVTLRNLLGNRGPQQPERDEVEEGEEELLEDEDGFDGEAEGWEAHDEEEEEEEGEEDRRSRGSGDMDEELPAPNGRPRNFLA